MNLGSETSGDQGQPGKGGDGAAFRHTPADEQAVKGDAASAQQQGSKVLGDVRQARRKAGRPPGTGGSKRDQTQMHLAATFAAADAMAYDPSVGEESAAGVSGRTRSKQPEAAATTQRQLEEAPHGDTLDDGVTAAAGLGAAPRGAGTQECSGHWAGKQPRNAQGRFMRVQLPPHHHTITAPAAAAAAAASHQMVPSVPAAAVPGSDAGAASPTSSGSAVSGAAASTGAPPAGSSGGKLPCTTAGQQQQQQLSSSSSSGNSVKVPAAEFAGSSTPSCTGAAAVIDTVLLQQSPGRTITITTAAAAAAASHQMVPSVLAAAVLGSDAGAASPTSSGSAVSGAAASTGAPPAGSSGGKPPLTAAGQKQQLSSNTGNSAKLTAEVDASLQHHIRAHHTATHLLQAALKQVLGPDTCQQGSLVEAARLRFDFNLSRPMTPEEISSVEALVSCWVADASPITVVGLSEARAAGAVAMVGDKNEDTLRVGEVPGVSMGLCGATHVSNTAEIGSFKVVSETGVASGVRRIEAVAGQAAVEYLAGRVAALQDELEAASKQLADAKAQVTVAKAGALASKAVPGPRGAGRVLVEELPGLDGKALQEAALSLLGQLGDPAAVLLASRGEGEAAGKVSFVAALSPQLVKGGLQAGKLVGTVTKLCGEGGGGSGKPALAQADGKDASQLPGAMQLAKETILGASF